ncbi:MAG TPA: flagellin [Terriglobales bacterium]|nr:flagellin [Terriglobales bacterium]
MALSVLNNIASLAAQNQLTITNGNLQKALFQLSSGSRINSGADDAAGLAIADGLHANITALTQSARNANDGVGELQVADGSLAQVTTLLNRAVTLATEAATGTVSDPQRVALDAEYSAIKAEIDRVGSKTNYNGGQVFTANTLNVFLSDAGATSNSTIGVTTGLLSATGLGLGGAVAATGTLTQAAGSAAVASTDTLTGAAWTQSAAAATTLTVAGGAIANNDHALIGGTDYKFVTALTGNANEVAIGGSDAQALLNLKAAVNAAPGGAGTAYGIGTVANDNVTAGTVTGTTLAFSANVNGTGGNAITSTTSGSGHISFTAGSLAGGTAGSTVTVGGKTYTFVTALSTTATANEVVASSEATGLTNLKAAVNGAAGAGSTYSSNTTANTLVTAGAVTGTTLVFAASTAGANGNFLATASSAGSWATLDFTGGADTGVAPSAAAGDTVTVGSQTYSFVSNLNTAPTANQIQVLAGSTNAASLTNLANAINGGSGAGVTYAYGSSATANTSARATASTDSIAFTALSPGVDGNSINTSASGSGANTFGAANLAGGTAGSINDLLTQSDATAALATINTAVQTVAGLRGTIGATVNRLQSAAGVINNQVQNLTGAEDGVRAADIPSTVATLAKYSILEQTGVSSLAQANQQQQLVLKLLQ